VNSDFSSASISPVLQVLYAGVLKSKNHKNLHVLNGSQNAKTQKRKFHREAVCLVFGVLCWLGVVGVLGLGC
jgi:hypothetical protein